MNNRMFLDLILEEIIKTERLMITDPEIAEEREKVLNNIILSGNGKSRIVVLSDVFSKLGMLHEEIKLSCNENTFKIPFNHRSEADKKVNLVISEFGNYFCDKINSISTTIDNENLQEVNNKLKETEEQFLNSSKELTLYEQCEIYALISKIKTKIFLFCIDNKIIVKPLKSEINQLLYGIICNIKALISSNSMIIKPYEIFELFKFNSDLSKYTAYFLELKSRKYGRKVTYGKEQENDRITLFRSTFSAYSIKQFKKIHVCIIAKKTLFETYNLFIFFDGKLCFEKNIASSNIKKTIEELTNEFDVFSYDEDICSNPFVFDIKDLGGFSIKPEYKNRIIGGANFKIIAIDEYSDTYSNEHLKIDWVRPYVYSKWYDSYLTQSNGVVLRKSSKVLGQKDDYIKYYINKRRVDIEELEDYRKKYISELIKHK